MYTGILFAKIQVFDISSSTKSIEIHKENVTNIKYIHILRQGREIRLKIVFFNILIHILIDISVTSIAN